MKNTNEKICSNTEKNIQTEDKYSDGTILTRYFLNQYRDKSLDELKIRFMEVKKYQKNLIEQFENGEIDEEVYRKEKGISGCEKGALSIARRIAANRENN